MGSGGKGGSASQSLNYYGTIAGAICWGPLDWLTALIHNGNYLWQGNLTITQDVTDLTGSILDPSKVGPGGYLKLYRGTETQPVDSAIGGSPNKGTAYIAAKNLFFGQNSGTPPNLQVIGGRLPRIDTSIVAGGDNIVDDGQVNPIAALAEILTDERGGGLSISQLDAASWLASAHWCAQDQDHRDATFCSPLFTDQTALRDVVSALLDPFNGFCHWTPAGLLACSIYEWGVDPGSLPILDATMWTEKPSIPLGDWTQVPTELLVSFTDRAYEYQTNTIIVPNERAAQIRQIADQKTLDRKHVTRITQAHRQAAEYNRRISTAPSPATIKVRQPFVAGISIGDKVKINTDPEPAGAGAAQLCRVDKIDQDRTDEATLTVTTDNLVPATPYTPTWPVLTPVVQTSPPLQHMLAVPLVPSVWGWPLAVGLLATRSAPNIAGFYAYFGVNDASAFSELGQQTGFAVRAALQAAINTSAGTIPITELDGESAPDAGLAAHTPGGNATAAADDTLLALIAQLDGNGRIALDSDGDPIMEFVSITDRASGSGLPAATYNYTVLRGRLGTTARAWSTGASVWIVPYGNIVTWRHGLLTSLAGMTAFFRLISYTAWAVDDSTPIPECGVNLPPLTAPMMATSIDHVENVFVRSPTQPATPTGNGIPAGCSDMPAAGTDQLWMSCSNQAADGTLIGSWAAFVAFGYGIQYSIDGLTAWHPVYADGDHYYEARTAGGAWSTPIRFVGESATHYWMVALGGIKVTTGGVFVPATITPSALQQTGTDAVLAYSGRFVIEDSPDGTTWTTRYTSADDESSHAFAPTAGCVLIRVSLYLAGGTTALVDQQLVPIAVDGTAGESGSSVLGTASGTATLTPTGMTATGIALTVTTPTLINAQCSGTLTNNGTTNSTFAVVLYMDGAPLGSGTGWNTTGNLNAGASTPFSFFGIPSIAAGAHTFEVRVGGYPESVTVAASLTIAAGITPAPASLLSPAAFRTAIGAGTSNFDGTYGSLSGQPTLGTASAHAATDFDAAGAAAAVTKTSIGLGAVTNDAQVKRTEMGSASGVATLDSGSHIPISQIPDALIGQVEYQGTWNPATNTPALPGASTVKGHYYITSFAGTYGGLSFDVGDWVISDGAQWDKVDNTDAVTMVAGRNGNITLTKGDVGLSNVDNTSDANKPVSTAQQTALNAKLDATAQAADVNPAGTSIAAALSGKVATALTVAGHALTADVVVSKGDVGLSNVDNTSDTNKPVSTAQATADSAVASAAAAAAAAATSLAFQADCSAWLQQSSLVIL